MKQIYALRSSHPPQSPRITLILRKVHPPLSEIRGISDSTSSLPLKTGITPEICKLKLDYEAGLLNYETDRKKLKRDVHKQFCQLIANKENIRIQQANLERANKKLDQTRVNYKNGLPNELDVLDSEVDVVILRPKIDCKTGRLRKQEPGLQMPSGRRLEHGNGTDG